MQSQVALHVMASCHGIVENEAGCGESFSLILSRLEASSTLWPSGLGVAENEAMCIIGP